MKIGWIGGYLDQWRANHSPAWFKEADPEVQAAPGQWIWP